MNTQKRTNTFRLNMSIAAGIILAMASCSSNTNTPKVSAKFEASTDTCMVPCTLNFENNSTEATSYNWDFGDGNGSTQKEPTHTFNAEGTYAVELMAINGDQSSSSTKTISVIGVDACKKVKIFYVIPSDQLDNEVPTDMLEATVEQNREKWSEYGATFVTEKLVKIYSDMTTAEFQNTNDGLHNDIKFNWFGNSVNEVIANSEVVLNDPNFKSILFVQAPATLECQCAALANFNFAAVPSAMITSIQNGVGADIGVIGHELGHTFGMPHEDCLNLTDPKGIMCNGTDGGQSLGFPNVRLTQWHYNYLFTDEHKSYFVEHACN